MRMEARGIIETANLHDDADFGLSLRLGNLNYFDPASGSDIVAISCLVAVTIN